MCKELTGRETEILFLRVAGYTRIAIAWELGIKISTVKTHLENIHRKLEVNSQSNLVRKAFEIGIVNVTKK